MFCKVCGKQIDDNSLFCNFCGSPVSTSAEGSFDGAVNTGQNVRKESRYDDSNFGFAVLSFLFPIIGLILFLIYEKNRPLRAKSCIKGTIAGAIAHVVLFIVSQILFMLFAGSVVSTLSESIVVQAF